MKVCPTEIFRPLIGIHTCGSEVSVLVELKVFTHQEMVTSVYWTWINS